VNSVTFCNPLIALFFSLYFFVQSIFHRFHYYLPKQFIRPIYNAALFILSQQYSHLQSQMCYLQIKRQTCLQDVCWRIKWIHWGSKSQNHFVHELREHWWQLCWDVVQVSTWRSQKATLHRDDTYDWGEIMNKWWWWWLITIALIFYVISGNAGTRLGSLRDT
jgi:hypothetical protein